MFEGKLMNIKNERVRVWLPETTIKRIKLKADSNGISLSRQLAILAEQALDSIDEIKDT